MAAGLDPPRPGVPLGLVRGDRGNQVRVQEPRAAVLLLVRDPAEAERALPSLLPGRSLRLIRREEVRHLTPLRLVWRLRSLRADELVMLTDNLDMHEGLWRLQALGAMQIGRAHV